MTRFRLMVCVLGTALVLLVPAVAQAQTVVINNDSSTQSTSTATSGGQTATTTTSGVGSTEIEVSGRVRSLDVENTGSSNTAANAGPNGATATGSSVNESNIDLDCGIGGCGARVDCVRTTCRPTVTRGHLHGHHPVPVHAAPIRRFVPFPVVQQQATQIVAGRDIDTCIVEGIEGLVSGANCLSLLNDLSLDISDLLDLGDVNLLSDLALDNLLNGLLGSTTGGLLGIL